MTNPIESSLPCHTDEEPTGAQPAFHAVVHLVVPCVDRNGTAVKTTIDASDYISETLRGQFLDWGYVLDADGDAQTPIEITVCAPYIEGTFLDED